jgi:hypothetical protein
VDGGWTAVSAGAGSAGCAIAVRAGRTAAAERKANWKRHRREAVMLDFLRSFGTRSARIAPYAQTADLCL